MSQIYTIGHSNHKSDFFLSILKNYQIEVVVDIRSIPFSKFNPQYNKENIRNYLKKNGITYLYMGNLLGAKYNNRDLLFDNGKVDFEKVKKTDDFQNGIFRLKDGLNKGFKIVLMCSEKEAFDCHRFCLISKYLKFTNIDVLHIYPDKILSQEELEKKLLYTYKKKLPSINLFNQDIKFTQELEIAYKFRNIDIAYSFIK